MSTSPDIAAGFAGHRLSFRLTGGGFDYDPATATFGLDAARLAEGLEVTIATSGPEGAGPSFRLALSLDAAAAPRLVTAPALAGPGTVGVPVAVDPGSWEGAGALALEWRRDGAAIEGATGESYLPGAEDDRTALTCRVTASNAAGSASAETAPLLVAFRAPAAVAALPDLALALDSGPALVAAAAAFAGEGLSFAVEGGGAVIDPTSAVVSLPTTALVKAATVTVTASNSGGAATAGFKASVVAVAPALLARPTLAGAGRIGASVGVDAGRWSGAPAPALALEWRRDGVAIKGATAASYTPAAADDRTALTCRVTATNAGGSASAETVALAVTREAPVARGALADVTLAQGAAAGSVAAAAAFAGEGLVFAVEGAGAVIDPATGVVSLPTAKLRSAEAVTVTARNSGGTATAGFKASVVAAGAPPVALGSLADLVLPLDNATTTVSTQAAFSGKDLVYALEAAPAGVTILAGSGLVSIAATAALAAAKVTVRASNAAGSASQSFGLTVRATQSAFDAAARLADLGFLYDGAAPSWTLKSTQGRLVPGASGRLHGAWSLAGGDGRYRALVRWNAADTAKAVSPFVFGARIARSGANFSGLYLEAARVSATERQLRLLQYTGAGSATTLRGSAVNAWVWYDWYWFEMELAGTAVKARLYAEAATEVPAWQLEASVTHVAAGAFGPAAFPAGTPTLDIKRLEFVPAPTPVAVPAAAADGDWELGQITEQE